MLHSQFGANDRHMPSKATLGFKPDREPTRTKRWNAPGILARFSSDVRLNTAGFQGYHKDWQSWSNEDASGVMDAVCLNPDHSEAKWVMALKHPA